MVLSTEYPHTPAHIQIRTPSFTRRAEQSATLLRGIAQEAAQMEQKRADRRRRLPTAAAWL